MQSSITVCSTGQSANHLHHRGDEVMPTQRFWKSVKTSSKNSSAFTNVYEIIRLFFSVILTSECWAKLAGYDRFSRSRTN